MRAFILHPGIFVLVVGVLVAINLQSRLHLVHLGACRLGHWRCRT
jgi:hypothetical protein